MMRILTCFLLATLISVSAKATDYLGQTVWKEVNGKLIYGYSLDATLEKIRVIVYGSEVKKLDGYDLYSGHSYWFDKNGWQYTKFDYTTCNTIITEMPNELKKPCTVSKLSSKYTDSYVEQTTYEIRDQILNIREEIVIKFIYDSRWSNDPDRKDYGIPMWEDQSWFKTDDYDKYSIEGMIRGITRDNKRCNGYVYW